MFAEESTAQQNSESSRTPDWFNALRSEPTYENSFLVEQLAAQATKSSGWNKLYTGFVDLDGTFSYTYKPTDAEKQLLNPEALKKLILEKSQPYIQASDRLTSKLQQRNISLIAVTGRDLSLIQRGQAGGSEYETAHFPQFVVCAGAVGTELYILQHDGSYLLDEQWENYIKNHFGFDRDLLYGGCVSVVERFRQHAPDMKLQFQSRDSLENVQAWRKDPQNASGQKPNLSPQKFKISFTCEGAQDVISQIRESFELLLKSDEINRPNIKVVFSHNESLSSDRHRFNIDLVPVTKTDVIHYMSEKYHVVGVVAGDSGNDTDMLLDSQIATIVGGAKPELLEVMKTLESAREVKGIGQKHLRLVQSETGENTQLLYIEPDQQEAKGPQSLEKALHAFELLDAIRKRNTQGKTQ